MLVWVRVTQSPELLSIFRLASCYGESVLLSFSVCLFLLPQYYLISSICSHAARLWQRSLLSELGFVGGILLGCNVYMYM